jgi:flagellar FliL protein
MATASRAIPRAVQTPPPEPDAEQQQVKKSGKTRYVILGFVLLLLLAGGGAAAWYVMTDGAMPGAAAKKPAPQPVKPPVFLPMETFTVNLQSEGIEQFLQVGFTLELPNQEQVDLLKLYMPHVRSRLLLLLSSKKAAEILSVEGKKKLSDEIIVLLKQPFTPQGPAVNVTSVLFTSFVVQ